jgi:hypothetical protein
MAVIVNANVMFVPEEYLGLVWLNALISVASQTCGCQFCAQWKQIDGTIYTT